MKWLEYVNKLENHGHKAYVIGGFVRDKLLKIKSFDIDITTSATPNEIKSIFNIGTQKDNYGSIHFQEHKYSIDITTFRRDIAYNNRHPQFEYITSLEKDVERRDFTINAIAIDQEGNYIDYCGGIEDLKNKLIKTIGDPKVKFKEDPLRILRALRFSIIYGFKIEEETFASMIELKDLINDLSYVRKREELDKIFISKNALNGFKTLEKTGFLKLLEIKMPDKFKPANKIESVWAQLEYSSNYPFTKKEKKKIKDIRSIIEQGSISEIEIFKYPLDTVMEAGEILNYSTSQIKDLHEKMPIHNERELNISYHEIQKLQNTSKYDIKTVKQDLINNILSGNLSNEFNILREYIIQKWK